MKTLIKLSKLYPPEEMQLYEPMAFVFRTSMVKVWLKEVDDVALSKLKSVCINDLKYLERRWGDLGLGHLKGGISFP